MRTRVENCLGGLAVVVPEGLTAQVGLRDDDGTDEELTAARLVVRPIGPATLVELLADIAPDKLHLEWAAGPPAGSELL